MSFFWIVRLKGYGNIFLFGLSIRTFGVIAISVVNFFEACSVSEILKDKDTSRPPSCFIIRSILMTSQAG